MKVNKALATEFVLAIGFNVWGAVKNGTVPWPPTIIRIAAAFGVLGLLANVAPEIAEMLGAGFLLAAFLNQASGQNSDGRWTKAFGALPPDTSTAFPYWTLGNGNVVGKGLQTGIPLKQN